MLGLHLIQQCEVNYMRSGNRKREGKAQTYNRALRVLGRMRRTDATLSAAAREEHIDIRTVRKYLGGELKKVAAGKIQPTKADRKRREMLVPTAGGPARATIRGSEEASQLGRYMSAVGRYLRTGDTDALLEFEGQSIGGHPLITDPSTLNHLAEAGSLQLDSIYALPEASS